MENSWIPAGKEEAVHRALAAAFSGRAVEAASPVSGGASGAHIWRMAVEGQAYLLRIESGRDNFRDPMRHYACLAIAAEAGIAPRLLYANADDGLAITDFIAADDGPPVPERLDVIARTVRALHATKTFPALVDHFDGLGFILEHVRGTGVLAPDVAALQSGLYRQCADAYPRGELEVVSSHNDFNPNNMLFEKGRLWLVDWESSFAADRFVDLGALANFLQLAQSGEDRLLTVYFGQPPSQRQKDRLALARQVARIFYCAVLLLVAMSERPGFQLTMEALLRFTTRGAGGAAPSVADFDGKVRLAGALFNEARTASASPAFAAALERLVRPA